nr:MAG TPA: hypothetical protein [Caudoviricetes sp.]
MADVKTLLEVMKGFFPKAKINRIGDTVIIQTDGEQYSVSLEESMEIRCGDELLAAYFLDESMICLAAKAARDIIADQASKALRNLLSTIESKSVDKTFKLRIYKKFGTDKGNTDHEEFFLTKEEMDKRYKELFVRNDYALNPTAWKRHVEDWTRIEGY